jgi:anthranilate phosphoribosyltransferase
MSQGLKPLLSQVAEGRSLDREQARAAFAILMSGEATPAQIGGFLMALRVRGETVEEIAGAVDILRGNMTAVRAPDDAVDIVGTGGDHAGTLNVSTCAAFVVAGCGVTVAKHGNRALSSRSGSADVLQALGVEVDLTPDAISRTISEAGIGFMFAPNHHAAMRFVGPSRVELGTRTIFNMLGPLANPAGVRRLLVGVYAPQWVRPVADALQALGAENAIVAHGDGLDEITVCGPTRIAHLEHGGITERTITPDEYGLEPRPLQDIIGGDAVHNAAALRAVLDGARGAYRDIVLLNAASALMVAGRVGGLREGLASASEAIDDGRALASLERLIEVSRAQKERLH